MTTNHHEPYTSAETAYWVTLEDRFSQLDAGITGLQTGLNAINQLRFGDDIEVTIASGAITITQTSHTVDTEADAATDDLETINGGAERDFLLLQCVNASHVVTVKHNTGNIYLAGGTDVTLDDVRKVLPLMFDGTKWVEVGSGYWTQILNLGTLTSVVIASDAITATKTSHVLDTEGGAATDNLATINGGRAGNILVLHSSSSARVITIKHGTGNIKCSGEHDIILNDPIRYVTFQYDGTNWQEIAGGRELLIREENDASLSPVRKLIFPERTLITQSGTNIYRASVTPHMEVADWWAIRSRGTAMANMGINSTLSASSTTESNQTTGRYSSLNTSGSAGNSAHVRSDYNSVRGSWDPEFIARIKMPASKNNRRIWIGLFNGATPGNVDTMTVQGIGFRYSDPAGDANWMAVCYNGTSQTTTSTGVSVAVSTEYILKLRVDSSNNKVYFSVNGSTEVQITTNIPASSVEFGGVVELVTTDAVAKEILFNRMYCEHK